MVRFTFFALLLSICLSVTAQISDSNSSLTPSVFKAHNQPFQSTQDVADYILKKKYNDLEKIRAAYNWVTSNIRYDRTNTFALNAGPNPRAKIDSAFTLRSGVCENFSAIFQDICEKLGFRAFVVEGITRPNNQIVDGAHTWVLLEIQDNWYFFDPTWDVDGSYSYFMISPEQFVSTHIPFDPMWQMLTHPEFVSGVDKKNPFYARDTLAAWLAMDSLQRLESAERRITNNPIKDKHIQTGLNVVRMNLEIERQGEQVDWHNQATVLLNDAVAALNTFIGYRNDLSILQKTDNELQRLLHTASKKMEEAVLFLDKIDQSKAKLVMGTWPERERIEKMKSTLKAQEIFFQVYKNTAIPERKKSFYQD